MKKLLVFIVFFLAFFSIMSIRVYASTVNPVDYNPTTNSDGDNYKIDTRSKKQALYSIWQVFMDDFDGEVNQRDSFRFYYLYQMLDLVSNPSQTQIIFYVNQCGIQYVVHEYNIETSTYKFNTLMISKHYEYFDTSLIEDENIEFYMDETAFSDTDEHIYYSILVSESTRGFILNSEVTNVQASIQTNENEEILTIKEHNAKYPYYQIDSTYISDIQSSLASNSLMIIIPFPWVLNETVHNYHEFTRSFSDNQTIYGYEENYNPISEEITYSYALGIVLNLTFRIIDDDKVLISYGDNRAYITKEQHYYRYLYNQTYQTLLEAEALGFTNATVLGIGNYFHQLGLFSGDTSNLNNQKYTKDTVESVHDRWGNSTYECIYDEYGNLVINSLVVGTFNFFNGVNNGHYAHDVIPYILWGNSYNDNSTWLERIAWDCQSRYLLDYGWQTLRGTDLYEAYDSSIYAKPLSTYEIVILQSRLGDPL